MLATGIMAAVKPDDVEWLILNWFCIAVPWAAAVYYGFRRVSAWQVSWMIGILAFGGLAPLIGLRVSYVAFFCLLASAAVVLKGWKLV